MTDNQAIKERPSKRSLTPNRSLYSSFNEAHRHIAPPTPKPPFEADLSHGEQLTPKQVENILKDTNQPKDSRDHEGKVKLEMPAYHSTIDQSSHDPKFTSASSPSAIASQSKTTNRGLQASVSPCDSDDEHAFIDTSVSSLHESKDKGDVQNTVDDSFEDQNSTNFPDASSFYPEDGATYLPDETEDLFALEKIKLEPTSSPILASLPTLLPPVASSSPDPAHLDDITKKQVASDYFDTTYLFGQNGAKYPIDTEHDNMSCCIPAMPTMVGLKEESKSELQYDADISVVSEDHFTNQEAKGKNSVSRLNPFHAFSAASSHESEMNFGQIEPGSEKVFMRAHAEKEVSRALHHATGLSQPSSGLIVGRTRPSHTNDLHDSPYKTHKSHQGVEFYHAPAIQPSWKVTESGLKVKVSVPTPNPTSYMDECDMKETQPYNAIDNTHMATASKAEERAVLEGDEDWRTVTDDREDYPAGAVGRVMTGSSIANVSDALLARQPNRQAHSTTTAWWGKTTPLTSLPALPSPSFPFPAISSLPSPPLPVATRRQRRQDGWEEIELKPIGVSSWEHVGETEQVGRQEYANLPFPLVAREDAARRQAVRRASGLEDQTLSGRVLSPGLSAPSAQGSHHVLHRPALRKDSARSLFSQIKNPNFDCRDLFIPDHQQNPFGRPEHEFFSTELSNRPRVSQITRDRASTNNSRKMDRTTPQATAEALAIDQSIGRPISPHLYSTEVLARYRAFHAVRGAGGRGTDSELADMAATVDDLPLSEMAQFRQKIFYRAVMAATLFLPFVGYIILACRADSILSAITSGECSGLSFNQRRNLRLMLLGGFAVWCVAVITGLITLAVTRT